MNGVSFWCELDVTNQACGFHHLSQTEECTWTEEQRGKVLLFLKHSDNVHLYSWHSLLIASWEADLLVSYVVPRYFNSPSRGQSEVTLGLIVVTLNLSVTTSNLDEGRVWGLHGMASQVNAVFKIGSENIWVHLSLSLKWKIRLWLTTVGLIT